MKTIRIALVICCMPLYALAQAPIVVEPVQQEQPPQQTTEVAKQAPEEKLGELKASFRSLFFDEEQLQELKRTEDIQKHIKLTGMEPAQDSKQSKTKRTAEPQIAKAMYVYTQFYLSSIAYHTPTEWAVWINGVKVTPQEPKALPRLTITSIEAQRIHCTYTAPAEEPIDFNVKPGPGVAIDAARRTITFSLSQNQTFSAYAMKVYEGKVEPVAVEIEPNAQAIKQLQEEQQPPTAQDVFNPQGAAEAADSATSNEGLPGLINLYKNIGK